VIRENAAFALSGSNVKIEFTVSPDLWTCDFDENQIGQVIDNLVLNAKQAMPRGGTIAISAKNVELAEGQVGGLGKGEFAMVSVADTGEGIDPGLLGRIFDPFFTTKQGGHGLGLATSYSVISKHGGHIEARSTPGKGSVFTFFLPASRARVDAGADRADEAAPKGSGTVLVMDDEVFMREVICGMLRGMGYGTLEAADGAQALRVLSEAEARGERISAAILDLTIPGGMGGKETIVEIRKTRPELTVFASSGFSEDPVIAKPRESGFTDSIQKPFRKGDLERLIRGSAAPPA
jgi:CheY-like chemotaxis protein